MGRFKYGRADTGVRGTDLRKANFLGVFGHTALDIIYSADSFPQPNTCVEMLNRSELFGGTGANVARMAASLGVRTALASHVGQDFPQAFMDALKASGVDVTDVVKVRGSRTPFIIMISDKDHNQIGFVDQGAVKEQERLPLRTHTIDSAQFVHIGTGRPSYALKAAKRAKARKKTVSFDPAQELHYVYDPKSFEEVLDHSDIFWANSSEMERAKQYLGLKEDVELLSHVKMVVNTRGSEGSRVMTDGDELIVGSIQPDKVVDTTGAGDGFRAGFYAGLSRGLAIEECVWTGASTASFVVESFGAQAALPTWEMVQRRSARRKCV